MPFYKISIKLQSLIPVYGILAFFILYIVATFYYSGGSQQDMHSIGFSWLHNYWCNLLNDKAINGEVNNAQPIAFVAMIILLLTIVLFWLFIPPYFFPNYRVRLSVQFLGITGISLGFFVFTHFHDFIINVATSFSIIAFIFLMNKLYKIREKRLFYFGLLNFVLIIINNYCYYVPGKILYLPVIQKFTFLSFLTWMATISISVNKKQHVKRTRSIKTIS